MVLSSGSPSDAMDAVAIRESLARSDASGDAIASLYKTAVASLSARVQGRSADDKPRPPPPPRRARVKKARCWHAGALPMVWFCDRAARRYAVGRSVAVDAKGAIVRERADLSSPVVATLPRGVEAVAVGDAFRGGAERLELSAPVAGWASAKLLRDGRGRGRAAAERTTVWRSTPGDDEATDRPVEGDDAPWTAADFARVAVEGRILGVRGIVGRAFDGNDGGAAGSEVYALRGGRRLLGDATTAPTAENVPGVPGAVFVRNVLDGRECARLTAAVRAAGLRPDALNTHEAACFVADDTAVARLSERLAPFLPAKSFAGLAPLWRAYRYSRAGAAPRAHYDDSSPCRSADASGALVEDRGRRSRLSVLLYVECGAGAAPPGVVPGGCTRFHPREASAGAVAVVPRRGSALVFYHGAHPDSPLHEGLPVAVGEEKLVIRTDALYFESSAR